MIINPARAGKTYDAARVKENKIINPQAGTNDE